jgi:hypothetical protein
VGIVSRVTKTARPAVDHKGGAFVPERTSAAMGKKREPADSSSSGKSRLPPSGEVVVTHKEEAAKPPEDKHIHPRRPLPLIPQAPPRKGEA